MTEIDWLERVAKESGDLGVLSYAFQPWVNLARIDRITGNLSGASERLEVLRKAWCSKSFCFHEIPVQARDWPLLIQRVPELPLYLRYNWVQENLLCALRGEFHDRLRGIATEVNNYRSEHILQDMLLEATLIASRFSGETNDELIETAYENSVQRFPVNIIFSIRYAELLLSQKESNYTRINSNAMSKIATHLLSGKPTPWQLAVVQPIVGLLWKFHQITAFTLAKAAYEASHRLGDENLEAWFAAACASADNSDSFWQTRRQKLAENSWHLAVRSPNNSDHDSRAGCVDQVAKRVVEFSQEVFKDQRKTFDTNISSLIDINFALPKLLQKIEPISSNKNTATAKLQFQKRQLYPLAPLLDSDTPDDIRSMVAASDFSEQASFAGKSYAEALNLATPITCYVLNKIRLHFQKLFGVDFNEDHFKVCVRVDKKDSYRQLQGAHVDWTKGCEFDQDTLDIGSSFPWKNNTFSSLGSCNAIDCVIGGPPTEFFLNAHNATLRLKSGEGEVWKIDDIDFDIQDEPTPGLTEYIILRPAYTIHQFPNPDNWRQHNKLRLFISCDYYNH
ncbi:MAG: hypothetical protein ACN4GR_02445 [Arenicellales bacterium]